MLHRWLLATGMAILWGCSTTSEVEIPVSRVPTDEFKELKVLGVAKSKGLTPWAHAYLMKRMKSCPDYRRKKVVNRFFKPDYKNPQVLRSSMESQVKKYAGRSGIHGLLVVTVVDNTYKKSSDKSEIALVRDQDEHEFFRKSPVVRYTGSLRERQIAPATKIRRKTAGVVGRESSVTLRYVLYNTVLKKVAVSGELKGAGIVHNYSKKPAINGGRLHLQVIQTMVDEIHAHSCPGRGTVTRTLYGSDEDSQTGRLLNAGIENVDDGRWESAAKKWRSVLTTDKHNALARHNLGVFYEQKGMPARAASEYRKANRGKGAKQIENRRYADILNRQFPGSEVRALRPMVLASDDSHWIRLHRPPWMRLQVGKTYPLYRSRPIYDGKNPRSIGSEFREVGLVRIVSGGRNQWLARPVNFLLPDGINPGDYIP